MPHHLPRICILAELVQRSGVGRPPPFFPQLCYYSDMRSRSFVALLVGTAIFLVAPQYDPILPDGWTNTMLPVWVALGGAAVVGALVVLIAGHREAWKLAVASAFAGALLSFAVSLAFGPPRLPGDFGVFNAVFEVLYFFAFTGPAAAVGGLLVGFALTLVNLLRRGRVG